MRKPIDLAIAPDQEGRLTFHRADCPLVRAQAAAGVPVLTMIDCDSISNLGWWHECLKEEKR